MLETEQIIAPVFSAVADDGTSYILSADVFEHENADENLYGGTNLTILLTPPAGKQTQITAQRGQFDSRFDTAEIWGDVLVVSTDGSRTHSDRVFAELDTNTFVSPGPIVSVTPFGQLLANQMTIEFREAGERILFNSGVTLIYDAK